VTLPSVSVAVCTRNRPASLKRCIAAVCAQSYLPKEVIIVDDGRLPPDTCLELQRQVEGRGIAWRYLSKNEPGLTRSRNLALAESQSPIVQFLDDDAEPSYDYLAATATILAADKDGEIAVLGGTLIEPFLDGPGGRFWRAGSAVAGWWSIGRRGMRREAWPKDLRSLGCVVPTLAVSGAALAVRRDLVWPPGFDENLQGYALGEDRDLTFRISRSYLVGCATKAMVTHHADPQGRLNPEGYGYASAYNYCYILNKNLRMGVGEWVAVIWSLLILCLIRLAYACTGSRDSLMELVGILRGSTAWTRRWLRLSGFCW